MFFTSVNPLHSLIKAQNGALLLNYCAWATRVLHFTLFFRCFANSLPRYKIAVKLLYQTDRSTYCSPGQFDCLYVMFTLIFCISVSWYHGCFPYLVYLVRVRVDIWISLVNSLCMSILARSGDFSSTPTRL